MKLSEELNKLEREKSLIRDPQIAKKMKNFSDNLVNQCIVKSSIQVGEIIPKLELTTTFGKTTIIDPDTLVSPIILVFYRGNWCPYCNLTLRYYQSKIDVIKETGARFIAISPQTADNSLSMKEKHALEFEVLSDINNVVAKRLGLVFTLSKEMVDLYKGFGHDLVKSNGTDNYEIPVPATFVLNNEGEVIVRHVDTDYTKRMNVEDMVSALNHLG